MQVSLLPINRNQQSITKTQHYNYLSNRAAINFIKQKLHPVSNSNKILIILKLEWGLYCGISKIPKPTITGVTLFLFTPK